MTGLYKQIGRLFGATGVLHTLLGLVVFHQQLGAIYAAGLINSIDERYDRGLAFWFVFAGLLMVVMGYLMDWVVRKKGLCLPASFGYLLSGLCLVGIVVMPVGGFWLALAQGLYISWQARHNA